MSEDARIDPTLWPDNWPHDVPDHPMTVTEAHYAMQRHRGCDRGECPRKSIAYHILVEAGKIKPDSHRMASYR